MLTFLQSPHFQILHVTPQFNFNDQNISLMTSRVNMSPKFHYKFWRCIKGQGVLKAQIFYHPVKISITGSVTDKNCSEQSQPEMSITQIKFKIQCSFRTSFPNYSQDNFSKTTKGGHNMHKQVSCSHAKNLNLL